LLRSPRAGDALIDPPVLNFHFIFPVSPCVYFSRNLQLVVEEKGEKKEKKGEEKEERGFYREKK